MSRTSRRQFLQQASHRRSRHCSAESRSGRSPFSGKAKPAATSAARVYVDTRRTISPIDKNLFGSFLEHLGRAIYEGIYDPEIEARRLQRLPQRRDGRNSQTRRTHHSLSRRKFRLRLQLARRRRPKDKTGRSFSTRPGIRSNSNQFGTNEFMAWCKAVGTEPLMGLNLGTGTPEQAAALVEYCNIDKGTQVERSAPQAWLR